MKKIKIGISPCPNDVFIFSGLLLNKVPTPGYQFEWCLEDVETLNQYSESAGYDVLKISAAQLGHVLNKKSFEESEYTLLQCGGAMGYGCGPLLLKSAQVDFQSDTGLVIESNEKILIPGERTTAHFLFQFYVKEQLHQAVNSTNDVEKIFLPFDEIYQRLCSIPNQKGVVIHESRFTYERDGLERVVDLGEYWEQKTGCPIPLGVLVVKNRNGNEGSSTGNSVLPFSEIMEGWVRASLDWAYKYPKEALELCRKHAQEMSDEVMEQHIKLYVNDYTKDMGVEGNKAIEYLLSHIDI